MRWMKEKEEERKPRKGTSSSKNCMNKVLRQETAKCGQVQGGVPMATGHVEEPLVLLMQPPRPTWVHTAVAREVVGLGTVAWILLSWGWCWNKWSGDPTPESL